MSRTEIRAYEREEDKFQKKFEKLNPTLKGLVVRLGQYMSNKYIARYMADLDRNIDAAVILSGGNTKQAFEMSYLVGQLMAEDSHKTSEFESEFNSEEECQMAVDKIVEEIKVEVKKLIEAGVTKKKAIEELTFKFPKLSKSMVTNVYQRTKEELEEDPRITEGLKYIFEGEDEMKDDKKVLEVGEKLEKKAEEVKVETPVVEKVNEESKLKVLTMTLKGENGTYRACKNGVELTEMGSIISFESIGQVDEFANEVKQVFEMMKA